MDNPFRILLAKSLSLSFVNSSSQASLHKKVHGGVDWCMQMYGFSAQMSWTVRIGEGGREGAYIILGSLDCILLHPASQDTPAATPTMLCPGAGQPMLWSFTY